MKKERSVSAIQDGTVIDHIPAGMGLKILYLLKIKNFNSRITIGLNFSSRLCGSKDLIKIENYFLSDKEACEVSVFAPQATISIIHNFQIQRKIKVALPAKIEGILACPNPECIVHSEPGATTFCIEQWRDVALFRCKHCEKLFDRGELR
jgi:aspartate carbamoyltransferase regulatory subunit